MEWEEEFTIFSWLRLLSLVIALFLLLLYILPLLIMTKVGLFLDQFLSDKN